MASATSLHAKLERAVAARDWDAVEELWLEALDETPVPVADLLETARGIVETGEQALTVTLLELLVEAVEGDHASMLEALKGLVRVTAKPPPELVERLETAFVAARVSHPSLRRVLDHHALRNCRRPLEVLEVMERWLDHDQGTVVEVSGQGVGRVIDLNLELGNVKVDVGGSRPVSVPFAVISRYLRRLPEGDFLRRKVEDPEALASFVVEAPEQALAEILVSLGGRGDVAAIKSALEGVLPAERWTAWWAKARKNPRVLSSGSGSRLSYELSSTAESATEALLDELRAADPRERLTLARRLALRGDEEALDAAQFLAETLAELETSNPGLAWETAGVLEGLPEGSRPAAACRERLLVAAQPLALLSGIGDRVARAEALEALRATRGSQWIETWGEWLLHENHPANLDLISRTLDGAGAVECLDNGLEVVFRNHLQYPAHFVWACEAMTAEGCPDALRRRMTPSLLELIPDSLTRKEFSPLRGRAKALLDGGSAAIRLLLEYASPQQASRFAQRVSRLSGVEPQRQRLVEQAAKQRQGAVVEPEEPPLVATRQAVEARKQELKHLLEVEIPKTLKGINAAAAEGDLRENFEYQMLRDRQELQSARAAKLQQELGEVRIIEPGTADTSVVSVGTTIHLEGLEGQVVEPLTILGVWDADLARRVFANGSEFAQRLLGRRVGDEVEVDGTRARIVGIKAWIDR